MLLPGAAQRERIDMDDLSCSRELLRFIKESPSAFHTVAAIRSRLDAAGFAYLPEHESWTVEPGGSYYTCRNGSSIIAFKFFSPDAEHCSNHFQKSSSPAVIVNIHSNNIFFLAKFRQPLWKAFFYDML